MKKLLLLILCALSLNSLAQTTSWSSSPPVTIQTRILSGSPQVRIIWTPSYIFSLSDSLNYLKGLFSGYQPLSAKLTSISALPNSTGVLTNNGSGGFSYVPPSTGTVTSITPGWSFISTTPITTTGSLITDSTKVQTVDNFATKGNTYYYPKSTSDSRYIKDNLTGAPEAKTVNVDHVIGDADVSANGPYYQFGGGLSGVTSLIGSQIAFGKSSFSNAFAFVGANSHIAWLSSANITGNNRYFLPDLDGKTLATIDGNQTFTSLNISGLSTFNNTQYIAGASGQSIAYFNGDSYSLTPGITATNSWVQLTSLSKNIFPQNNAVSGSQVADQTTYIYGRTTVNTSVNFHQLGTNDLTVFLTDTAKQTAFRYALRANLFYMAVPNTKKILGTAASLTGTWTNTPVYGIGKTSTLSGSTATATISGSTVLVAIQQGFTGYGGTATVTIDGTGYGTFSGATSVDITTQGGRAYSPKLLKFTGLANTSHTVVIATTNNSPFYLDWVAGIDGTTLSPRTYVGNIPYRTAGGYSSFGGSNALVDTYNAIISGVVSEVSGLGGSISLADINAVINPATDISGDGLHPNNAGQIKMANTYIAAYVANTSNIGFYGTQFLYNTGNASAGVFSTTSSIFPNSYNIDHINKVGFSINGTSKFNIDGSDINVTDNISPTANHTYNLGNSTNRWGTMFIGAIDADAGITTNGITSGNIASGSITPTSNNLYNLGASSFRFGTSYLTNVDIAGSLTLGSSVFTISGGFNTTLTVTAATNVTLPISGTLYSTTSGSATATQLRTTLTGTTTGTGNAVFSANPTLSGTTNTGNIQPTSNNASNLGAASFRYGTGFLNALNLTGAITSTSNATFDGVGDFGGSAVNSGIVARGGNSSYNGLRISNSTGTAHWATLELTDGSGGQGPFYIYDIVANIPFLTITKTTGVASFYSSLAIGGPLNLKNYTVATLPTGSLGDTAVVTDALAPTYGAAVVGTGTVVTTVLKNATTWVVN